jgi:hypothetical protein
MKIEVRFNGYITNVNIDRVVMKDLENEEFELDITDNLPDPKDDDISDYEFVKSLYKNEKNYFIVDIGKVRVFIKKPEDLWDFIYSYLPKSGIIFYLSNSNEIEKPLDIIYSFEKGLIEL